MGNNEPLAEQYRLRAAYWDCFLGDRAAEIQFWAERAANYGPRLLAPLCATGEVAAGLAQQGFRVVGLDLVGEMVRAGRQRMRRYNSLSFLQADVTLLPFPAGAFDFVFLGTGDFHHFVTRNSQMEVLQELWRVLRPGGGLGLELYPPPGESRSRSSGKKKFPPLRPPAEENIQLWKESETRFDAPSRQLHIAQTMFVHRPEGWAQSSYAFTLQLHVPGDLHALLASAGFSPAGEYGSFQGEPFQDGPAQWIVIAEK